MEVQPGAVDNMIRDLLIPGCPRVTQVEHFGLYAVLNASFGQLEYHLLYAAEAIGVVGLVEV